MCRHLGYLGPPVSVRDLLYGPEHSLHVQSYAPRRQRHGRVNADGFGVGWHDAARGTVRYRRALPMWADASFAEVAGVVRTPCLVAAVRDATPGFPSDESCAQPFASDGRLFSHAGVVDNFAAVEDRLRSLGITGVPDARAAVDSALLFAIAVRLWRDGASLASGLAGVVEAVGVGAGRLNLLASDGASLAATVVGDEFFVRERGGAVVLASEPYDDESGWREVADGSLVTADEADVKIVSL